jgi:Sec-independent protein secretion pathway component TatC
MGDLNARNLTLMALITSLFLQVGGGFFAISIVVSTLTAAPPRSFAMLAGEYPYNSSAFWETLPPITAVLFVIALIANWKTTRRRLVLAAFALFILGGVLAGFFLEPEFAKISEAGYRDVVDPELQRRARSWYALDWAVWTLTLVAGLALLLALAHPVTAHNKPDADLTS